MKVIDVVCGISIDDNGLFLARRNGGKSNGGLWEFPGGKVDENENHQKALSREFLEELNIVVEVKNYFMNSEFILNDEKIILYCYFVNFNSEPTYSNDHDLLVRVKKDEILKLKISKADIPFIHKLINNEMI